jgi:hypothetical protein
MNEEAHLRPKVKRNPIPKKALLRLSREQSRNRRFTPMNADSFREEIASARSATG